MSAFSKNEALDIANLNGVEVGVMKTNLRYIGGIARYLFEPGNAKLKVEDVAL